jgi:hypothetical protein
LGERKEVKGSLPGLVSLPRRRAGVRRAANDGLRLLVRSPVVDGSSARGGAQLCLVQHAACTHSHTWKREIENRRSCHIAYLRERESATGWMDGKAINLVLN